MEKKKAETDRIQALPRLVEGGRQGGVAEVVEEVSNLRGRDATEGKWGKMVFGEKLGVGSLVAVLRRATYEFGEKKKFVGMKEVGRMAVEVAVKDGCEFADANLIAGLFAGFTDGSEGRGFTHIGPASGEGPATVLEFADEEDATILEGSDADIDFGSGVTGLPGEKFFQGIGSGKSRRSGQHFRGYGADLMVALDIEFVLTIGEAGLGDGLEASRPSEPLRNGHEGILAASAQRNKPSARSNG